MKIRACGASFLEFPAESKSKQITYHLKGNRSGKKNLGITIGPLC